MEEGNANLQGSRTKESSLFFPPLKNGRWCLCRRDQVRKKEPRKEGVNPELRWSVNLRIDLRPSYSRSGDGRERWRYSASVRFLRVSCQFHLQHHFWHFQQAVSYAIQPGCFLSPPGTSLLALGIWQLLTALPSLFWVSPFPSFRHWPCPGAPPAVPCSLSLSPQLHRILLGVTSLVKYRHVLGQWFSLLLICMIAKPFRKLELEMYHFIVTK